MKPLRMIPLLALSTLSACATSPRPTIAAAPSTPAAPATAQAAPVIDPPGTRRVRGIGWSAALPVGWTESVDNRGITIWRVAVAEDHPEHRAFSVEVVHGTETFEQMVAQLPGAYRAREATSDHHLFTHAGRPAAEFEVRFPARVQQLPMYFAVLVEGRQGLVVTCGGEAADTLERTCRETLSTAWFGANASAQPRAATLPGRRWYGAHGRYVQVPDGWRAMTGASAPQGDAMGLADEGEHHAIVLNFLNDLAVTPDQAVETARGNFVRDSANSLVHAEPIHSGRRVGVQVDAVRAAVSAAASTLVQWVIPAGPGAFFTVNCAGTTEDVAAHPEVCRDVMSTFAPTQAP